MENHRVENAVVDEYDSSGQKDTSPPDMLRFFSKHYMTSYHCCHHIEFVTSRWAEMVK